MMVGTKIQPATKGYDRVHQRAQAVAELQEVCLQQGTDKVVKIGKALDEAVKSELVRFLQEHQDCFAWSLDDMDRIPTRFAQHSLNVYKVTKPVK